MVQRYDFGTVGPSDKHDEGAFVSYADYSSVEADLVAARQQLEDLRVESRKEIEKRVEAIKSALEDLQQQGAELNQLRGLLKHIREWIDAKIPRPPPPALEDMRNAFEEFTRKVTPK